MRVSRVSVHGMPYARLTVADTGAGIRPEIRPNLFTQFFTTKGSRGTGLGLWLTRDIVHRNGGRLLFRSRVGSPGGTVFSIYLPSVPPATPPISIPFITSAGGPRWKPPNRAGILAPKRLLRRKSASNL